MSLEPTEDLRRALSEYDADRFASHMLFDRVPWLWNSRTEYIEWKTTLARGLDVDPYSLIVVGSACTGISLNPKKNFSQFGDTSDVDVAVMSSYHFELAWKTLRELGRPSAEIPTKSQKYVLRQHREYLVFDGTIAADWILPHLPFGNNWRDALRQSELTLPGDRREVKARIYRDMDALRAYHVRNIEKIKQGLTLPSLAEENVDDDSGAPLPTDTTPH